MLLIDPKSAATSSRSTPGGEFHTHAGFVAHDELIGRRRGRHRPLHRGAALPARPARRWPTSCSRCPAARRSSIPKDLGPILMLADIFPGARVLESGVGSGALSMTLLRAGADVTGYELRERLRRPGRRERRRRSSAPRPLERYTVEQRDCYEGIDETDLDRVVLDLPEPWQVVQARRARRCARAASSSPTRRDHPGRRSSARRSAASGFGLAETIEVLNRGWHVEGQAVRPDHRMVAHTGFLTPARLLS